MALFDFLKRKKHFFSAKEQERIVAAVKSMEQQTSGEIRIFVESKNPYEDAIDRAAEVFSNLKMEQTELRNGVLLYIAMEHKQLALFGDQGIFTVTGPEYWNKAVANMLSHFKGNNIVEGIVQCIYEVGQTLKEKFPYDPAGDKNELPDDIVFGD